MAVRINQETGGFKLLEEDALDDRPCSAVKKFVSSVLDRKDMKDQEVANSFRNLMEYRDSTSSPPACSMANSSALDGVRHSSPPSPSSPTTVPGPMDDQRLPNELLDEICEDIGMKEGMELDFVEYLMEQDTNPQLYMTQEAISSGSFNSGPGSTISTPTGSGSGGSNSGSDSKTLTVLHPAVSTTTTPNFLFKQHFTDSEWHHNQQQQHTAPLTHTSSSPSSSSSSASSGSSVIKPAENSHPAGKRGHSSMSMDSGHSKGRPHTPPGFGHHGGGAYTGVAHNGLFKMPQPGPVTVKRSQSYPHGALTSSAVQSGQGTSPSSHSSSVLGVSRSLDNSGHPSCQPVDTTGDNTPNNLPNKKNNCVSPKTSQVATSSCDFVKSGSPVQFQGHAGQLSSYTESAGERDGGVHMKMEKYPSMAGVGVKTFQHQQQQLHQQDARWTNQPPSHYSSGHFFNKVMYSPSVYSNPHYPHGHHHPNSGHAFHMLGPSGPQHLPVRTSVDSPLDQGYFSNESAGNCSNGSAPSPAFTSSSASSFSSISTMMPTDSSQKFSQKSSLVQQEGSGSRSSGQKSVHFADVPHGSPPAYTSSPGTTAAESKPLFSSGNGEVSDCAFESEGNGQPRFHHGMKSSMAQYNSQGMGAVYSGSCDYNARCRVSGNMSDDEPVTGEIMQDYVSRRSKYNNSGGSFYIDNNQNMMRMDPIHDYPSAPPPLISPQSGEYVGMQAPPGQPHYGMDQFSPMQQQAAAHLQQQHPSSTEPMHPPHPQMMPHHHQQYLHQLSSCSQVMDSDFSPQGNLHAGNGSDSYQVPLAMSTPVSSRGAPLYGGSYGSQPCPPGFQNSYGHLDVYSPQQALEPPPVSHIMMSSQQNSAAHRGWSPQINGPEDLRVHPGGFGQVKGALHPPQPQMQHCSNPSNASATPMGPGPHPMGMQNVSPSINPHHMGPHPDYGPCPGLPCKMPHPSNPSQHLIHLGPCMGPNCQSCKMNHPCCGPVPPHVGPCSEPNCTYCKMNPASRPQMLSSQQKFIQHLVMDEGNSAYRSHPLFPLLRDLVIAEMSFDNPQLHYQQLLSLLPNDFHKLLQNFLHRNPPSGHYQSNEAVESVIMDGLRLAHSTLVEKIQHRQEMEKVKANSSASLRSMEEFCQKFDHSVSGPMPGRPLQNGMGPMPGGSPMSIYEGGYLQPGVGHMYRPMKDGADMFGDNGLGAASPQGNKTESKKHPSLPKEAVAMMMEWLRNHKDNPYPNDDEKAMLIKQTGLSINQINYWFTNARRRILPKWSQCKT